MREAFNTLRYMNIHTFNVLNCELSSILVKSCLIESIREVTIYHIIQEYNSKINSLVFLQCITNKHLLLISLTEIHNLKSIPFLNSPIIL